MHLYAETGVVVLGVDDVTCGLAPDAARAAGLQLLRLADLVDAGWQSQPSDYEGPSMLELQSAGLPDGSRQ